MLQPYSVLQQPGPLRGQGRSCQAAPPPLPRRHYHPVQVCIRPLMKPSDSQH